MRAFVCERYGPPDVLRLAEVPDPEPGDDEVLIRSVATTVTAGDARVRGLDTPRGFKLMMRLALGFTGPRKAILGTEVAGRVEAVGSNVTGFAVGDPVFAFTDARMGCHAELVAARASAVAAKPPNLSFEQAAALSFGGTTALHFFRKANLRRGERLLVNGASGGVGTAAVQLAKHFGAEVTGVCSAANADLVRSLGAAHVIDYATQDFTSGSYDVIMDTAGTAPYSRSKAALAKGGRLLLVNASLPAMLAIPRARLTSSHRFVAGPAVGKPDDLRLLADLATQGTYTPVIDRTFAFEQLPDAHRYVETGRKKGNVVVKVGG